MRSLVKTILLLLTLFIVDVEYGEARFTCDLGASNVGNFELEKFAGTWYLVYTSPDFFYLFNNGSVNLTVLGNSSLYGSAMVNALGFIPTPFDVVLELEENNTFIERLAKIPFLGATKVLEATDYDQFAIWRCCVGSEGYTELVFRHRCPDKKALDAAKAAIEKLNLDFNTFRRDPAASGSNCD